MLKLIPNQHFQLTTKLSREELLRRLKDVVKPEFSAFEPVILSSEASPSRPHFAGVVNVDSFRIRRIIRYRNSAQPELAGTLHSHGSETIVEVQAGLSRSARLVYASLLLGLAVCLLASLAVLFVTGAGLLLASLFAVMLVVLVGGTLVGFDGEVARSIQLLEQTFGTAGVP